MPDIFLPPVAPASATALHAVAVRVDTRMLRRRCGTHLLVAVISYYSVTFTGAVHRNLAVIRQLLCYVHGGAVHRNRMVFVCGIFVLWGYHCVLLAVVQCVVDCLVLAVLAGSVAELVRRLLLSRVDWFFAVASCVGVGATVHSADCMQAGASSPQNNPF